MNTSDHSNIQVLQVDTCKNYRPDILFPSGLISKFSGRVYQCVNMNIKKEAPYKGCFYCKNMNKKDEYK